jgi:uncharacterized membrane protein YraQ (UPF0718 family)
MSPVRTRQMSVTIAVGVLLVVAGAVCVVLTAAVRLWAVMLLDVVACLAAGFTVGRLMDETRQDIDVLCIPEMIGGDARYLAEPKPPRASHQYPDIEHWAGEPWKEARVPRRWHRCWPQTRARFTDGQVVFRCPCGAIRNARYLGWSDRNSRKRPGEAVPETPYIERKQAEIDERERDYQRMLARFEPPPSSE